MKMDFVSALSNILFLCPLYADTFALSFASHQGNCLGLLWQEWRYIQILEIYPDIGDM